MGRIQEGFRGARFVSSYLMSMPVALRRVARADTAEAALDELRRFARSHLEAAGIEVEVTGHEKLPSSGYVLTYNETALPDVLVIQGYLMGALVDLAVTAPVWRRMPWFSAAAQRLGLEVVPSVRPAVDALMNQFAEEARGGARILWGGEGGLSGKDGVGRFKTGGARIAIRGGVPLVPAAIHGGQLALPLRGLRLRPRTIRVQIGDPIFPDGTSEDDARTLADRCRDAVAALYDGLR